MPRAASEKAVAEVVGPQRSTGEHVAHRVGGGHIRHTRLHIDALTASDHDSPNRAHRAHLRPQQAAGGAHDGAPAGVPADSARDALGWDLSPCHYYCRHCHQPQPDHRHAGPPLRLFPLSTFPGFPVSPSLSSSPFQSPNPPSRRR